MIFLSQKYRQYPYYGQHPAQSYQAQQMQPQQTPQMQPQQMQQMMQGYQQQAAPFPTVPVPSGIGPGPGGQLPQEQSYVENILRLNIGKVATVYATFENNEKWNAKVFRGEVLAAGRDHLILQDTQTDRRYLILMVYVDYVTFDEPIEYSYPYTLETYPSR